MQAKNGPTSRFLQMTNNLYKSTMENPGKMIAKHDQMVALDSKLPKELKLSRCQDVGDFKASTKSALTEFLSRTTSIASSI